MVHINIPLAEIFKHKFPYPEPKYLLDEFEGQRIDRVGKRWRVWGMLIALLFILAFTVGFMFLFGALNDFIYKVVVSGPGWYHQDWAVFLAAGVVVSIPLGVYMTGWVIRFFHPFDHIYIIDRLNAADGFDNKASVLWFLKVCTGLAAVVFIMSSWAYVRVTDDGFRVKGSFTVFVQQFGYPDVRAVHHYKYRRFYSGGEQFDTFDHYQLYLKDGRRFSDIAPSVDEQACLRFMLEKGKLKVVEDSVEVL